jgi:hypothetical protein
LKRRLRILAAAAEEAAEAAAWYEGKFESDRTTI